MLIPKAQCISCGNDSRLLRKLPGTLSNYMACDVCYARFIDKGLAAEADRLLTLILDRPGPLCPVCGNPLVYMDHVGNVPAWCRDCESQRQRIMNESARTSA